MVDGWETSGMVESVEISRVNIRTPSLDLSVWMNHPDDMDFNIAHARIRGSPFPQLHLRSACKCGTG